MLVGLFEHPDPLVRGEAALRLGQVIDRDAATGLAQLSLADPDPDVRRAAALAIAYALDPAPGQPGLPGLERLVAADSESASHQAARAALITVRDRQPASNRSIPSPLRLAVQRAVWRERWKRHWGEILGRTLQGFQGGFWGLGLSLGLLLFLLFNLKVDVCFKEIAGDLRYILGMTFFMVPLVGLVGGAVGGTDAFGLTVLARVGDRPRPWRVWAVMTLVSALVMGLGFVILSLVGLGDLRPAQQHGCRLSHRPGLDRRGDCPTQTFAAYPAGCDGSSGHGGVCSGRPTASGPLRAGRHYPETLSTVKGATVKLVARVEPFLQADGSPTANGSIQPVKRLAGDGTSMWLEGHNATLSFKFSPPLISLYTCIDLGAGPPVSVWVNGQRRGVGTADGITVSLGSCSSGTKVVIEGPVETFAVGGQDWAMDILCPTFAEPVHACMEFEGLQARRALLSDQFETWQMLLVGALCGLGFFLGLESQDAGVDAHIITASGPARRHPDG